MIEILKKQMEDDSVKALKNLQTQLSKVRTGRASANVLDGIMVDYYGSPTAVAQVGQVSTPEARLLQVQPFDKSLIGAIEKAILGANIGLNPSNDGNLIRIPFPALTEEKRKDLVKDVKKMGEEAKIVIRNSRREQNEVVKKSEKAKELTEDESKKHQKEIQDITDINIKKVDEVISAKEKELLTV